MHAVLLDFNGTMFFDTRFHMEAWSKFYHELHPEDKSPLASTKICGPCNDVILKNMAPWLTPGERQQYSEKKEALYREAADLRFPVSGAPEDCADRLLAALAVQQKERSDLL